MSAKPLYESPRTVAELVKQPRLMLRRWAKELGLTDTDQKKYDFIDMTSQHQAEAIALALEQREGNVALRALKREVQEVLQAEATQCRTITGIKTITLQAQLAVLTLPTGDKVRTGASTQYFVEIVFDDDDQVRIPLSLKQHEEFLAKWAKQKVVTMQHEIKETELIEVSDEQGTLPSLR